MFTGRIARYPRVAAALVLASGLGLIAPTEGSAQSLCLTGPRLVVEPTTCVQGSTCRVRLLLEAAGNEIPSLSGSFVVPPELVLGQTAVGSCASNGAAFGAGANFVVSDLSPPFEPFCDGPVLLADLACASVGQFDLALADVSLGTSTGQPLAGACGAAGTVTCSAPSICGDGTLGDGEQCDDGNTLDGDCCSSTCQLVVGSCDDGNACTTGDTCAGGSCQAGTPLACADGNVCTNDTCDPATGCVFTNNTAPCDDGSACTTGDTCAGGSCQAGTPLACTDDNVCTNDTCNPSSGCVFTDNAAPCSDGNACTTGDTCAGGSCQAGSPLQCTDGNGCTDDTCNPASGCVFTNNAAPCSDGNACTTGDTCGGGSCRSGSSLQCTDGNGCTDDTCDPASGCVFANNAVSCDDGVFCNGSDTCVAGACTAHGGGPCTGAGQVCDEAARVCVVVDCTSPSDPACDDGNACTDDSCNVADGTCQHVSNTAPCSDGNACTTGDTCAGGSCQAGTLLTCTDGNLCTTDTCNPARGCVFTNNAAPCSDGNACTTGDTCAGGSCQAGSPLQCTDGNGCTDDTCSPASGCVFTNNAASCDDGIFCNGADTCASGACTAHGGDPCAGTGQRCDEAAQRCLVLECTSLSDQACDDGNACTDDSCNVAGGTCQHVSNTSPCSDGNACTTGDTCAGGSCQAGTPLVCDDGDVCTSDACEATTGCVFTAAPTGCPPEPASCGNGVLDAGEECDDGNTLDGDGCQSGCVLPVCGDGVRDAGEQCDDGGANSDVAPDACRTDCTPARCGDGVIDAAEQCDLGNTASPTCCTGSCRLAVAGATCRTALGVCDRAESCTGTSPQCPPDELAGPEVVCRASTGECDSAEVCDGVGLACPADSLASDGTSCSSGVCSGGQCIADPAPTCVGLSLPSHMICEAGRDCTMALTMQSGGLSVASVTARVDDETGLICRDCVAGAAAANAECSMVDESCGLRVVDATPPSTSLADGEIAEVTIQCQPQDSGRICATPLVAIGPGGEIELPTCEPECIEYACRACMAGDCDGNEQRDGDDVVCAERCLIGVPSPDVDCGCGADCNCVGGTEVSDLTCAILRSLGSFGLQTGDTCEVPSPASLELVQGAAQAEVRVRIGKTRPTRSGKRNRAFVILRKRAANQVGALRVTLSADAGAIGPIRLTQRLAKAGFRVRIDRRSSRNAVAVISPPSVDPLPAIGRGRALRVVVPEAASGLAVGRAELGSTTGFPMSVAGVGGDG